MGRGRPPVGIPDDFGAETMEGRVLPTCLAEIDRCRPYFIGILGERYGWVPKRYRQSWRTYGPGFAIIPSIR
jgi:hypothetical protein